MFQDFLLNQGGLVTGNRFAAYILDNDVDIWEFELRDHRGSLLSRNR